jgi:hypothetical protein
MSTIQNILRWIAISAYLWVFVHLAFGLFTFIYYGPGSSIKHLVSALAGLVVSIVCFKLSSGHGADRVQVTLE